MSHLQATVRAVGSLAAAAKALAPPASGCAGLLLTRTFNSTTGHCKDTPSTDTSPSSGELYGREDRDPFPSPNPGLKQGTADEMSFPRDEPPGQETTDEHGNVRVAKPEGYKDPEAYPIQNDPSIPEGAGPNLDKLDPGQGEASLTEQLASVKADESQGPKAAGQGVVEDIAKKDPERHGSDRASPA